MRKFIASMAMLCLGHAVSAQIINKKTTPAELATIIPAFSQVTTLLSAPTYMAFSVCFRITQVCENKLTIIKENIDISISISSLI
jgi:hypothetical protein